MKQGNTRRMAGFDSAGQGTEMRSLAGKPHPDWARVETVSLARLYEHYNCTSTTIVCISREGCRWLRSNCLKIWTLTLWRRGTTTPRAPSAFLSQTGSLIYGRRFSTKWATRQFGRMG